MRREDFVVEGIPPGYQVWDADLAPDGQVACVLASPPDVDAPAHLSDLPLSNVPPLAWVDGKALSLPPESFHLMGEQRKHASPPHVRWAGQDSVVLFRRRADEGEINAWSITPLGQVESAFHAGDAISDLLADDSRLVVTYFDEGILGGTALDALAILDLDGNLLTGYGRGMKAEERVSIADCYCACLSGESEVTFRAYAWRSPAQPSFPLIRWNFASMTQDVWEVGGIPPCDAITSIGSRIFLHADDQIVEWTVGAYGSSALAVEFRRHTLRGLSGGRFIAVNPGGYTILSFD